MVGNESVSLQKYELMRLLPNGVPTRIAASSFSLAFQANEPENMYIRRSSTYGYEDSTFQVICFCVCSAGECYSYGVIRVSTFQVVTVCMLLQGVCLWSERPDFHNRGSQTCGRRQPSISACKAGLHHSFRK